MLETLKHLVFAIIVFKGMTVITRAKHDEGICGNTSLNASIPELAWNIPTGGVGNPSVQCQWTLTAALGKKVELTVNTISFTEELSCVSNQLDIFDGPGIPGTLHSQICRKMSESVFISDGYEMFVQFTAGNVESGFTGSYKEINGIHADQHDTDICGDEVINTANAVESWNVPVSNKKAQNKQCRWRLFADRGMKVQLKIDGISLSGNNDNADCGLNKVQLFQGSNETGELIYTICKSSDNNTFISEGQELFVKFTAVDVTAGTGFRLSYRQINTAQISNSNKAILVVFYSIWVTAQTIDFK